MESTDEDRVFISVISLAELRYGVERLAAGSRRRRLEEWLGRELPLRFEGRILPVDTNVAEVWGKTVSRSEAAGRPSRRNRCPSGGNSRSPSADAGDPQHFRFSAA
jgi:predicted nucleic acid-binding protein